MLWCIQVVLVYVDTGSMTHAEKCVIICWLAEACSSSSSSPSSTASTGAGHVTAGGSICIEALTVSGTNGSWTSQYNVESILNIVMMNMIGGAASCCQYSAHGNLCLEEDLSHIFLHTS